MKHNFAYLKRLALVCAISALSFAAGAIELRSQTLTLLLTSNIEGRSSVVADGSKDFLLNLGSSLVYETEKGNVDLYLDLGNGFYPGALSRFSMGAVMMDFFDFFDCASTLVSTKDLRIGIDNLDFLQANKKTKLLSGNIVKKGAPVFEPFFVFEKAGKKIGFAGLSSKNIMVDIAEKNVFDISIDSSDDALARSVSAMKEKGVDYIVLLSGMSNKDNMGILKKFSDINLIIAGGDNTGSISGGRVQRIDLEGNRTILFLSDKNSYYSVELNLEKKISVREFRPRKITERKTASRKFKEFSERLALWKKEYMKEGDAVIAMADKKGILLDDERIGNLLRHKFNCETAIVAKGSMKGVILSGEVRKNDLIDLANDEFPLFQYYLTGDKLSKLLTVADFHFSGVYDGSIQGYPIDPQRKYRVVSTQTVFDRVKRTLRDSVPFKNLWVDITGAVESDLKQEKALLSSDYGYLERRFRATVDIKLSNFFDLLDLAADSGFSAPGSPTASYRQWGLENDIAVVVYNRYHRFLFNPYLNYIEMRKEKLDEETGETSTEKLLIKNLLRGIFEYKLNYFSYVNPYHKSQLDTVVKRDEKGERPAFVREVAGANFTYGNLEGKLGAGFERKINDPKEDPVWGFETYLFWKYGILRYFTYSIKYDSFIAKSEKEDREGGYIRSELTNALEYKITNLIGVSLKHRWYYYKTEAEEKSYNYKQYLVSLDVKTDFKLF